MKALIGENPAVQPLLIDDSMAAPAISNDEDEEAIGEVDVHHDETQLGDEMVESVCLCWERRTKDKCKAPPSLQNARIQSRQNFATALKEAAQEKALAIWEADDKRLQWEKEKWEDEKRER
ncbi:hypothetical protein PsorP6_013146 [Peronosclerospora sorghi]|uniref:Uncharacterized protein n=1 Tax=Peronosclerospora sorghi TaxID=230839 RepID=A0ACC0WHT4_9STRA|nr:hypothetical protein PsorP6_013146 [Peronosclerospora sorghi]